MNIEISCPTCGYNEYKALNTETNQNVTIIVSLCDGVCDLQIVEEELSNKFDCLSELVLHKKYKILEQTLSNCTE